MILSGQRFLQTKLRGGTTKFKSKIPKRQIEISTVVIIIKSSLQRYSDYSGFQVDSLKDESNAWFEYTLVMESGWKSTTGRSSGEILNFPFRLHSSVASYEEGNIILKELTFCRAISNIFSLSRRIRLDLTEFVWRTWAAKMTPLSKFLSRLELGL